MKITFLGQAGFYIEENNTKILIDPYLSDSVAKTEPQNKRRVPISEKFLKIKPDVIVCTHAHGDHYDEETLKHYLSDDSNITFLSPRSVWEKVRQFGGNNNYVLFNSLTEFSVNGIKFKAVNAVHSDSFAIGVIVTIENKNYYFTGDTLYSDVVLDGVKNQKFEAVFLPVNGKGNNMNKTDAVRFFNALKAKTMVPCHIGLFDDITADDIVVNKKVIPSIYEEIVL